MTDNEKRAHDFALTVSVNLCNISREIRLASGETKIETDYFAQYMSVYKDALANFNEQFPDGK